MRLQTRPYSETHRLTARVTPTGKYSISMVPAGKRKVAYEPPLPPESKGEMSVEELDEVREYISTTGNLPSEINMIDDQGKEKTLGLSKARNSQTYVLRGLKGITPHQRDLVKFAGTQIERVYGINILSFATLCLPSFTKEQVKSCQSSWSKIVHALNDEIAIALRLKGITPVVVGCTEIQEQRSAAFGDNLPHIHIVFPGRLSARSPWAIRCSELDSLWRRILERFVDTSGISFNATCNIQRVKKSVAGYLAKYLSKGRKAASEETEIGWLPSSYAIVSNRLRRLYRKLTLSGSGVASWLIESIREGTLVIGYTRPIEISTVAYGRRLIGEYGWLKGYGFYLTAREWFTGVDSVESAQ